MKNIVSFLQFQLENVLLVLGDLAAFLTSEEVHHFVGQTEVLLLETLLLVALFLPFLLVVLL
jgi:hypothetical protein